MSSKIKQELESYNEGYKSGMMMSLKESIEAEFYCNMFLKKIDEIEKLNISEEDKISILIDYAQNGYNAGIANENIYYKYNIENMLKVINGGSVKR